MSKKSIYEEAKEILLNMGTEFISVPCNPIGEENSDMIHLRDATETYETNIQGVVKALEHAQKQDKLLGLYRKIYHISPMKNETKESYWARVEYLDNKIKELENDK